MNGKDVAFIIVCGLMGIGVFHELAHALTALAFGYRCLKIYIGFPVSYTLLSGGNFWVSVSGGLTDVVVCVLLFAVWWKCKVAFTFPRHGVEWLLFTAAWRLVYALYEGLVLR